MGGEVGEVGGGCLSAVLSRKVEKCCSQMFRQFAAYDLCTVHQSRVRPESRLIFKFFFCQHLISFHTDKLLGFLVLVVSFGSFTLLLAQFIIMTQTRAVSTQPAIN